MLVVTLKEPRTSQGFIDRFLVTTKPITSPPYCSSISRSLSRKKEENRFEEWKTMYEAIGYRVIRMSVETGEGLEEVNKQLQGKISLLSGHSGVGKSSFLNALFPTGI